MAENRGTIQEELESGRRKRKEEEEEEESPTIEKTFENVSVPSWQEQLTFRSLMASVALGFLFTIIVMKLNLTTGVIPSINVAAGLLGFFFVRTWTSLLLGCGWLKQPFTRQENTVIQTSVVATSGIAFSSGFGSYILGMSEKVATQAGEGDTPNNMKYLSLGWMYGFIFVVSFVGLFSVVTLRKTMIIDYKLTFPSGTATAYLINSFHTAKGAKLAKKQVAKLFQWFSISFVWAFFQWFFTSSDGCGFASFPTFGLQAFKKRFYFDFSGTYIGVGMICPFMVNISMLMGAIVSWLIMWPLIEKKKGIWYDAQVSASSLHGIQGYRVFIGIAMMLGDGLFHFFFLLVVSIRNYMKQRQKKREASSIIPVDGNTTQGGGVVMSYDDKRRTEFFLKDQIPNWFAYVGYVTFAVISIITVPLIFPQLKWYFILITYFIAPIFAFCNSYGCGLTDWSLASNYGKLAIFIFSSVVGGLENGGVVAGLAACGVMMSIVSTASDLMQDFKTGYLTLASPRAMFCSQIIGTALGCLYAPIVFWFFYKTYPVGNPDSSYPAPYAQLYRGIALLGAEGTDSLPDHCLTLAIIFFFLAIALNIITQLLKRFETKWKLYRFVPSPMCMAIPFYLGGYFVIDMCVGSLIVFLWQKKNKANADAFGPAVASGMICGDSLWSVPAAVLTIFNVNPPICMKFLSAATNTKVDGFLEG